MIQFTLKNNDYIALCDLLKTTQLCQTGGHAKIVISEGDVLVDGEVELRKRCKIRAGQVVEFEGQKIQVSGS